ncbi:MAG: InlB B-repeat-containing protein, partial [Clostridia bacterium]|nr:InlB B-repeat-containing protein [Clostridia bacterium]
TIVVNTEKLKYTMFVSNGEGGTVSPNEIVVEYGSSLTFTVTPNPGYKIKAVTYQTASSLGTTYGNPVTPENLESFTISNIKANYKIVATFEKLSYTIDVTVGTGGLVSPTGAVITVNHGDNKTFTFTPDEGYEIEDVLVNSTSVGTDATYTFTNITQNHTLEVIFKQSSYTLTYNLNYPGCSNTTQTYTYQQTISAIAYPARTNYSFAGWYTEAECINPYTFTTMPAKDVEVFAKWNINTYTITWLNYNNAVLGTSTVAHGSTPQYPYNTPVKDSTEQYVYEFTGWDPELVEATESTSYTAVFTESIRQYTVSFYSDNGRLLKEVLVNYGTTVIYGATNPEKEATAQYSYTFDKWVTTQNGDTEVDLASITQDTKAYAKFTETVRKYTIVFANYDNTVLQSEELEYGQTPVYKGQTPTRPDENTVVYTFSGWNKEIATVTGNVTYIAVYNVSGKFTVNFYLDDGRTILEQCYITPGESASFTLGTPEKEATAQYTYEFVKWVTTPDGDVEADLSNITQNTSIYAKFNPVLRSYIITFVNYNDEILQSEELEYGSTPEYTKNTPQRPATNEYTYTFTGWDPKIEAVSGNQTYKAIFSQTEVYTVEFLSDDGLTVLHTEYVSKNTAAVYDVTPTKQPTAQYSYTFDKWVTTLDGDVEADLSNIIQNTRVYAKFTPVINKYTVTFVNYDDTVLQQGDYSYGDTPEYTGETPTRPATNEHSYSFIGWTPGISPVINDITYTARYSQSDKYVVTFYSEDGSTILDQCFVGYGEKATYNGSTPEKVKTAEFSYKFNKWVTEPGGNIEDKLTDVVKSRNVYASFTPVKNKYTVKFVNFDGTELKSETLDYGAKPLYNIALPERPATAQFTYEFIGWSPEIDFVTADAIYTAIYNEIINQYTITVKVGKNGVVSPGSVTLDYGQTQVFSITPNEHYEISKITLDGVLVAPNSTIEIPNINQNHTLNVEFAKITFMITTTTDENGRITPSTSVEITGTHRIDFYPDEGYDIKDVKVDNVSIGIVPYYTFVSINQHHTISVEYKIKEYSVTMHIDGKGVVSPINTISVNHGDEIIVTLTPEGGWEILKLYVNGESYTVKNNQVVIPCINEDLQIQAVFTLIQSDGSIGTTIVVIAAIIAGLAVCLVFAYLLIKYVKGNKTEEKGFDDLTKNLQKLNKNKPENNNTEEQNNTKAQAKPAPK